MEQRVSLRDCIDTEELVSPAGTPIEKIKENARRLLVFVIGLGKKVENIESDSSTAC